MCPSRQKKAEPEGLENPPEPVIAISGEGPATIRELLLETKFKPEPELNDILGTRLQKAAIRRWLKRQKACDPPLRPHPTLLAQLWLRQWISQTEYDSYFPERPSNGDE